MAFARRRLPWSYGALPVTSEQSEGMISPSEQPSTHPFATPLERSQRRSRLDICYEIMVAIKENREIKPTQLMYSVNLSWKVLSELLSYLSGRGLIRLNQVGARKIVTLTELGASCLVQFNDVHRTLFPGEA
jgi:predicted transcriptional regulator